jgi:HEAT repeat protein
VRAEFFAALRLEDPSLSGGAAADAPGIVAQYERTLRTSLDEEARRLAVLALDRLNVERAIPALGDAVAGDPSEAVRLRAAAALGRHVSHEAARRALVRAVADPNVDVAVAAVRALAKRRDADVVAALQRRLGAGAEEVQDVVEAALADLHRVDPTPFLDWMMGVDVPDLLTPAVRVLARIATPQTFPLLKHLLGSRSALVRAAAVRAIGNLPLAEASAAIDGMAQDPSEDVRTALVDAVEWSASALTRMAQLRRDPSVRVRTRVAGALERLGGPAARSAHKALEWMMGDAAAEVRAAALASLAGSPDAEGLRAFGRLWPHTALDTRLAIRSVPRAPSISERLAARLSTSPDPVLRRSAVAALGALGAPGYTAHVVPALRDPSADVRVAAIQALATVDDADVRARLGEMVADPENVVQEAARRSLLHTVG